MNPETGRFSATYVVNVTKVAENQNGSISYDQDDNIVVTEKSLYLDKHIKTISQV